MWAWLLKILRTTVAPSPVVVAPQGLTIDEHGYVQGPGVTQVPTARTQRLATPDGRPGGIVWHYTNTVGVCASNLAKRIANKPAAGERSASWHIAIDRDGSLVQSASLLRGTWHAGGPTASLFSRSASGWLIDPAGKLSANSWAIGVEMIGGGRVKYKNSRWRIWPFADNAPAIPDEDRELDKVGRSWQRFTPAQYATAVRLANAIDMAYGIRGRAALWGHMQIDPTNREDPGPFFLPELAAEIERSRETRA